MLFHEELWYSTMSTAISLSHPVYQKEFFFCTISKWGKATKGGDRNPPSPPSLPPSTPRPRPSPLRPRLGMQGLVSISGPGPCSSAESSLSHTHTHRCIALHKSLEITSSWLRVNLVPIEHRAQKTEDTKRTVISPVRPVLHSSDSAVCGSVQPLKSAALCVITPQNSHFQHWESQPEIKLVRLVGERSCSGSAYTFWSLHQSWRNDDEGVLRITSVQQQNPERRQERSNETRRTNR